MHRTTAAQRADARHLREAARLVEKKSDTTSGAVNLYNRSCWALNLAQGSARYCEGTPLTARYIDVMLGGEYCTSRLFSDGDLQEDMDVRVLLLCFAAAMAETGDL